MSLADVSARCNHICHWCEKPINLKLAPEHSMAPSREHLIPRALRKKGTPTDPKTVVIAHKACNELRGIIDAAAFKSLMNGSRLNKFELWPHIFKVE